MSNSKQVVTLRPTYIHQWMTCPKKLAYLLAGVSPQYKSVNLIFGQIIHEVIELFLKGYLLEPELGPWFVSTWRKAVRENVIEFPKSKNSAVFEAIGTTLIERFPGYWNSLGLEPLYCELPLKLDIGNDVHLGMTIDFVGQATWDRYDSEGALMFRAGDTVIIDWKTQAAVEPVGFGMHSFQFAYYWLALTKHADRLGIKPPTACGYAVGIKPDARSAESKSIVKSNWEPVLYSTRSKSIQVEALQVAHMCAESIRNNTLYRNPGMAFNTPCDSAMATCDFTSPCIYGEQGNLHYPDSVNFIKLVA